MRCDHCQDEIKVWYRVGNLILCYNCKGEADAKNSSKERQKKIEAEHRQVEPQRA